jgi:hypothetical protein
MQAIWVLAALVGCGAGEPGVPASGSADETGKQEEPPPATAPGPGGTAARIDAGTVPGEPSAAPPVEPAGARPAARVIDFDWCPSDRAAGAYVMTDPADRHTVVLTPGVEPGGRYPVVVAVHGQPKRGRDPRDYWFVGHVRELVMSMVERGLIEPVILVLPVFRFEGGNWPWMNPKKLRDRVEELLAAHGVEGGDWYAFGHSGAAGCGGAGLNQAHLMGPKAIGFFDTCLGAGWEEALAAARKAGIRCLDVHSVETAGFRPRQTPEYQSGFDFGRAFGPAGMEPVACPAVHPGERLRDQGHRCAASPDGLLTAFVVDTGEGSEAHQALVEPAVRFFLTEFAGLGAD